MCYHRVVLFLCIILCSSQATIVKYLPTTSFNLPSNFDYEKFPCSKSTVVFPQIVLAPIILESEISVKGFILPKEGDIILANGMTVFGADEADVNCTEEGNVYYLERVVKKWWEPDIWSSPRFNDATPDAERVPCFDDIVEFPTKTEFILSLADQTQSIVGMKFGNYTCRTLTSCQDFLVSSNLEHYFILNQFLTYSLIFEEKKCMSRAGCPCQKNSLEIDCKSKYCPVPECVDPIKPKGHCCKICGGVISFDIDESFDLMTFKELVEKIVKSYGIDSVIYHLGRLPNDKIQLVVVDKAEYLGTSAEVVNVIDHQMNRHWVQGAKYVDISGSPLDKSGLGAKIFVSVFFLVVLIMGGIYVYYYKLPEVAHVRFPIFRRTAPGVFSTFQTRTDSVVCLTRRDSEAPIGYSTESAFRNPLYDSTRQRKEVEETGADE